VSIANGYFKPLLDPGGGFRSGTAVTQLPLPRPHVTATPQQKKVSAWVQRPWPLAKINGFFLVWEVGMFNC
jgi:hypothetical protein